MIHIDLRSDTVTHPTKEMKKAMKRGMSFNKAHKYAMKKVGR